MGVTLANIAIIVDIIAMRPNEEKKSKAPVPTSLLHLEHAKAQQVRQPGA